MGREPVELNNLWSKDRRAQNEAFEQVMAATDEPVAWAYEVWDEVVANLEHPDNHNRAIAAQLLSNLARSDPERRILGDLDKLMQVTRDERFVTARHALQSLWKVGVAGDPQRDRLLEALRQRFEESDGEKNSTLIRYDIVVVLRKIHDEVGDPDSRELALALIESETDDKYRRKYAGEWKDKR